MANDAHDLDRFRQAQDRGGTFDRALAELRRGRKESHWMWFIFPQLAGLGHSPTAQAFALRSLDEAAAYLRDPVLGIRLRRCAGALLDLGDESAEAVLGPVDALKLRSSVTLFSRVPEADDVFARVLERFYGGQPDPRTLELLDGFSDERFVAP